VVRLDVVDSTNRYAADAARRGAPDGLVVVAEEQTAGRGRLARTWVAPRGEALLCSVVLRPGLGVENLHLVPTAVALAAADAAAQTSGATITMKWPNDLVAGDAKVGGVLAEVVAPADRAGEAPAALVVGVGINLEAGGVLALLGEEAAGRVTGLTELAGRPVARDEVLEAMLGSLRRRWGANRPPDRSTMEEYRARCSTLGRRVRADTVRGSFSGLARLIDDAGRLIVDLGGGEVALDTADIIHLRDDPPDGASAS
jgi:BirA family transcriptional regulator, biotin operon repressor / biotin---[acetyl-CoA-carboxylase] ligase